jgi:tetratricopeptide (TPR) repeat protein
MIRSRSPILVFLILLPLLGGCASLALRLNPTLLTNMTRSLFEECDVELAREALPGSLKMLEGLLKSDFQNRQILSSLSMGFGGYALLFLEADAPERASRFYLRSREYGVRALGSGGDLLRDPETPQPQVQALLAALGPEDLEALFWTTFSWSGWINLNLDKPSAIAQLGPSQACLKRVIEMDGSYFQGLPYILQGVLFSARPALLGGDREKARARFEEALEVSHRKFFPAQYYYARHYAVAAQDRKLFLSLLREIIRGDPHELKEVCLINTVMQQKAAMLARQVDELFF